MAEVVGVIGVGVQLIETAAKLRKLWKSAKDAPKEIMALADEIETFTLLLSEFGQLIAQNTCLPATSFTWNTLCQSCENLLAKLKLVQKDAEDRMARSKSVGRVKFALKKEIVAELRFGLERAKTSFTMAHLSYMTTVSVAQLTLTKQGNSDVLIAIQQVVPNPQSHTDELALDDQILPSASAQDLDIQDLGNFKDGTNQDVARYDTRRTKARKRAQVLELKTPTWLLGKVWTFQMARAYQGWDFHLRAYRTWTKNSAFYKYIENGDLKGLQELFATGAATPFDKDEYGDPILYIACDFVKPDIARFLLEQGADVDEDLDLSRWMLCWVAMRWRVAADEQNYLALLRLFVDEYQCEAFIGEERARFLHICVGDPPDLLKYRIQLMYPPYNECDIIERVNNASGARSPENFWLLLGESEFDESHFTTRTNHITADFYSRQQCGYQLLSNIATLMTQVFVKVENSNGHQDAFNEVLVGWREILRQVVNSANSLSWPSTSISCLSIISVDRFIDTQQIDIATDFTTDFTTESTKLLRFWISELITAGADIVSYGRIEGDLKEHWGNRGSIRFHSFTYGPQIEDWKIEVVEVYSRPLMYAGQFWYRIENPEEFMPGSWVEGVGEYVLEYEDGSDNDDMKRRKRRQRKIHRWHLNHAASIDYAC